MAIDKVLNKIQIEINELAPVLELFVDNAVPPTSENCDTLQKHLICLQEYLAVYKYNKQNKEMSPSFLLHAKLSEKEAEAKKQSEAVQEIKLAVKMEEAEKQEVKAEKVEPDPIVIPVEPLRTEKITEPVKTEERSDSIKKENGKAKTALVIGLNDKFRFMNELFSQNSLEYNIAVEQLNNLSNWNDTEIYLNSLKTLYGWKEQQEVVKHFFSLAKQRFF